LKEIIKTKLSYLTLFGVAMGFMEAIIVIYLRKIYYPAGFNFPLAEISGDILIAELVRELCTVIMLLSLAAIAGKTVLQKFSFFLFSFAVWDIFYYIGLKVFINWPPSLFTWDILFLIPITWLGPVIAPVISSVSMIILSLVLLYFHEKTADFRLSRIEILLIISGAVIIFISFIWDFSSIIISNHLYTAVFNFAENEHFQEIISSYIPQHFNWTVFITGNILIYLSMFLMMRRSSKNNHKIMH
jgi:hypothetical protein